MNRNTYTLLSVVFIFTIFFGGGSYGEEWNVEKALEAGTKFRKSWVLDKPIDEAKVKAAKLNVIKGKYVTLYTDLPLSKSVSELPKIFDMAVPMWCEYLKVDPKELDSWHLTACLIGDFQKFLPSGLVDEVPNLRHGYSQRHKFWIREQQEEYYRRHLFLHEGVHCLMTHLFGRFGALWYMEGTAELLAVHRWNSGKLEIGFMPESREEVPSFYRIDTIARLVREGEKITVNDVFNLSYTKFQETEAYALSWAMSILCANHPDYRDAFWEYVIEIPRNLSPVRFSELLGPEKMAALEVDWAYFISHISYNYDLGRDVITDPTRAKMGPGKGKVIELRTDTGWSNSGIAIEKGKNYQIEARGRYSIMAKPVVWWCEPQGVTIKYCDGRPLGQLLACVIPSIKRDAAEAVREPMVIGTGTTFEAESSGTLFFRINEHSVDLHDNTGTIKIGVRER